MDDRDRERESQGNLYCQDNLMMIELFFLFLCLWNSFLGNALEKALIRISREDVAKKCMYDVVTFEDEMEMAAGRVAMDQSGKLFSKDISDRFLLDQINHF